MNLSTLGLEYVVMRGKAFGAVFGIAPSVPDCRSNSDLVCMIDFPELHKRYVC